MDKENPLEVAAHELYGKYGMYKNVAAIGMGADKIIIYLKKKTRHEFPTIFKGFPVETFISGPFMALGA